MADQIKNISDYILRLEELIARVDAGDITESKARVQLSARKLQLSAAALNLQYQRMMKWSAGDFPMLPAKDKAKEAVPGPN